MTAKQKREQQQEAIKTLRMYLPPGSTVHTILRHTSKSGMMRGIDCILLYKGDRETIESLWLSRLIAKALDWRIHKPTESIRTEGCGMDMGFHIVNNLSYVLHGIKDTGSPSFIVGGPSCSPLPGHYRAGYSLNHRWL